MKLLWGTLCLTAASLIANVVQAAPVSDHADVLHLMQTAQTVPMIVRGGSVDSRHEIQLVDHCGRGYRGGGHYHGGGYHGGYRGGYHNSYRPSYGYGPGYGGGYPGYPGYYGGYPRSGFGLYIRF